MSLLSVVLKNRAEHNSIVDACYGQIGRPSTLSWTNVVLERNSISYQLATDCASVHLFTPPSSHPSLMGSFPALGPAWPTFFVDHVTALFLAPDAVSW